MWSVTTLTNNTEIILTTLTNNTEIILNWCIDVFVQTKQWGHSKYIPGEDVILIIFKIFLKDLRYWTLDCLHLSFPHVDNLCLICLANIVFLTSMTCYTTNNVNFMILYNKFVWKNVTFFWNILCPVHQPGYLNRVTVRKL